MSEKLKNAVIDMDSEVASATAIEIVANNLDIADAVVNGLNAGMRAVAEKYDRKETFLPQVLASANAFYVAFDILRPHLSTNIDRPGRFLIIGVVEGDMHDIGKNLIKVLMECHGYDCIDLGRDVPNEEFLEKILQNNPDYVAISTLMTPTLRSMRDLLRELNEKDIRKGCKIMVGGGQVSREFADEIGADFYGVNDKDTIAWLKQQESKDVDL